MILIVCLDDQNGMAFNHRRQSRDCLVIERIENLVAGKKLWMAPYSQKLFSIENLVVSAGYLSEADAADYCFAELDDVRQYENQVQKVIVFRWNRHYPSDVRFGIGRFDELKKSVDKSKAKAFFEAYEQVKLIPPKVNMKTDRLLRKFILSGGFEISMP